MKPKGKTPRILVVDDEEEFQSLVAEHLRYEKYEVSLASDGLQGLDSARKNPPDLIIADLAMPNLDGIGMLKALRTDDRFCKIPVIVLSVMVEKNDKQRAFEAGAAAFLNKPCGIEELLDAIKACLRGDRPLASPIPKPGV